MAAARERPLKLGYKEEALLDANRDSDSVTVREIIGSHLLLEVHVSRI